MTSSTTPADVLAAREAADAALLVAQEVTLSALMDNPTACVTDSAFMGHLLAYAGDWTSEFANLVMDRLCDMFAEKTDGMFESFRVVDDGTFILGLGMEQDSAHLEAFRKNEELAELIVAMSAHLLSHGFKFTLSVRVRRGEGPEVRESFHVINDSGMTIRFRPQLRGRGQKAYKHLQSAFKDSFTVVCEW